MDRLRIIVLLLLVLGLTARMSYAQDRVAPDREVIDRIVAVVGDSVILKTDLDEEVFRLLSSTGQQEMPADKKAQDQLYRTALDNRVNELIMLIAAARDSITVGDAEVERQVEQQIMQQTRAFGGAAAFEEALRAQGLTLPSYRDEMTRQVRNQGIIESYLGTVRRDRRPPPLTEREVKSHFDKQRDQLGERPAAVSFDLVILAPRASDEARTAARTEAERILEEVRKGESFEQLARRYSQDPGSKDRGGDLGWFREGQMVREFSEVAFSLPPGSVSGVVESSFGFHIIKVEKSKGAERRARHILIVPKVTSADADRSREAADEVLELMRARAPIDSLVTEFGDPADSDQGKVGPFPKDRLPEPFDNLLANARTDDLIGPFAIPGQRGNRWAVLRVTMSTEAGPYRWEDPTVRTQFKQQLEQQLLVEEIVAELRDRTFIDLRI